MFYHKDQWIIATNGTPVAMKEFSDLFQQSINLPVERFDTVFNNEHTYLFEIEMCTPENKIDVKKIQFSSKAVMESMRLCPPIPSGRRALRPHQAAQHRLTGRSG